MASPFIYGLKFFADVAKNGYRPQLNLILDGVVKIIFMNYKDPGAGLAQLHCLFNLCVHNTHMPSMGFPPRLSQDTLP